MPCALRSKQPLEGLNEKQREKLKPRDRNKSEEERWEAIYRYCFPDDQIIPSPCKSTELLLVLIRHSNALSRLHTLHLGDSTS